MKKKYFLIVAVIAALVSSGAVRAEITTVILSDDTASTFNVVAKENSIDTKTLTFSIGPAFIAGAKVRTCKLRVVPTPQSNSPRDDQDVTVLWSEKQVGQWSAYSKTTEPYAAELKPEACTPGSSTSFTLKTESKFTNWEYYGGGATDPENRPRLIVTYDSPTPAHTGDMTDWAYSNPAAFFSSPLWPVPGVGSEMLTNPVSYDGAVYLVAACSTGRCLYRVAGARNVVSWPLGFDLTAKSFAFVTAWGRLQIITQNAIRSCNLTTLPALKSQDKLLCDTNDHGQKITLKEGETPTMGPDGSLYFKNADADGSGSGSIVAYNPSLQEIWRTDLKLTTVSPIALSANGQYAYVLADLATEGAATKKITLLRIDTATGETVTHDISYCPSGTDSCKDDQKVKPQLGTLFQPAVASKVINQSIVDYVFVAGNADNTGVLQLIAFEPGAAPSVVWNKLGQVATAPVLSVDGNSLFVAWQDAPVFRYSWYNTAQGKTGAYKWTDAEFKKEQLGVLPATKLLVDRGGSLYRDAGRGANRSLWVVPPGSKAGIAAIGVGSKELQFTNDGSLIGYTEKELSDFSPKSAPSISPLPSPLATKTIYSADTVTVPSNPSVKSGDQVILKGTKIQFPPNFNWPVGATLKVQSVQ